MIRRGAIMVVASLLSAWVPAQAQAQEMGAAAAEQPSRYLSSEQGWDTHRFHVSGYGGRLSGGTSVGSVSNLFFQTVFKQGSDTSFGGRIGYTFASRFDAEIEYGQSSPGLLAVVSDLQGQGRTEAEFADLDVRHLMGVVNYSIVERSRRLAPYLSLGIGTVRVRSSDEPVVDANKVGLIYGLGLRARLVDRVYFRSDIRGMRAGFGSRSDVAGELPGFLRGNFRGTYLLWSVGAEVRF